jgi:homogentisate phytyltransferase/homogentisate geranylgeranyltransferase
MSNRVRNFLLFSRLHTVIGTIISITSLYFIAIPGLDSGMINIHYLLLTLLACLGANIYIVGLNQLTDIDIDKQNKPYLPLASGAYSVRLAKWIIYISLLISICLGIYYGGFLLITILISLFLGTIYSLPPLRLKRFYFWAAFCIIAIRGLVVNIGLFLHFNSVINHRLEIPSMIWILSSVIFVFSLVIAWFKDIPDMEGDRNHRIRTLTLVLGAKKVFLYGNLILLILYSTIILVASCFSLNWNSRIVIISHCVFIIALLIVASKIKPAEKLSMRPYYQFIWLLFFMEYIAFALSHLMLK